MKIRVVTIDFWGTLVLDSPGSDDQRYRAPRMAGFDKILQNAGFHFLAPQLTRAYEVSGEYLSGVWRTRRDVAVVDHVMAVLRALDESLAERVSPDVLEALVEAYARPALLGPPAVDPSARAALAQLRADGIHLAIVSNTMRTPGSTLRAVLARCQLLEHFEHTVFSDEVGVRKPDPAIFQMALQAFGCEAGAAVHVGDDALLDVLGARAAGLRVVQIMPRNAGKPPISERPDRTITQLGELPAAIATLQAG